MPSPLGIRARRGNQDLLASVVAPVFNPASLSLSGWWRGNYAGAPWAGTASAGGSAAQSLVAGTAAAVGAALNGITPADFNGTTQEIENATSFFSFASSTQGSVWILFRADTASADLGAGNRIDNKGMLAQDTGGTGFGLGFSTSGVCVAYYDGTYKEIVIACPTLSYHLVFCRWNGALLELGLDSAALSTIAAGTNGGAGSLVVGKNYSTAYFDGQIMDIGMTTSLLSNGDRTNIVSYVNSRYGLAL